MSVLVLYHTNWELVDSSNIKYGFMQVVFSVKLEQIGSKFASLCSIRWVELKFKLTFVVVGWKCILISR